MALKAYNPTSPARRGLILVDRSALWKGKPVKKLTEGKTKTGNHADADAHRLGDPVVVEGVLQEERDAQDQHNRADPQHHAAANGLL